MTPGSGSAHARKLRRIFEVLEQLGDGQDRLRPRLLELLPAAPAELTPVLLSAAVRHAGTPQSRAAFRSHSRRGSWARWLPVDALEYRVVLGDDPAFELGMRAALARSGWAARHRRALATARRPGELKVAAAALRRDLDRVAAEAAAILGQVPSLRAEIRPPLHAVQAQALLRAERALGDLEGLRALEIGCGAGALLSALRERGAEAEGMDLAPASAGSGPKVLRADFADTPSSRRYDLVVATGVFEAGSCRTGAPQGGSLAAERLLARLKAATVVGGVVVLENFGLPLPFSLPLARRVGFALVRQALPGVNWALGGRGCTLRRVR